jgi:TonB family protein
MSRRQPSWPGWVAALVVHGLVVGALLLHRPAPRPSAIRRPPVRVALVAPRPVPTRLAVEPPRVAEVKPTRPRPARRRVSPIASARPVAAAAAPVTPRAAAQPASAAPRPRFSVSMSATISSGGVALPAVAPGKQQVRGEPSWARDPERGSAGAGAATGNGPVAAVEATDALRPPRLIEQPTASLLRASYPARARADGVEADVGLKILVDAAGRVAAVRLLRRAGNGFDEAAQRLIRSFRFEAGKDRAGRRVSVWIPWTYKFRLNG